MKSERGGRGSRLRRVTEANCNAGPTNDRACDRMEGDCVAPALGSRSAGYLPPAGAPSREDGGRHSPSGMTSQSTTYAISPGNAAERKDTTT